MSEVEAKHSKAADDLLAPLHKVVEVSCGREEAFRIFTEGLSSWWPLATHSVSTERAESCAVEPRVGGEVYEVRDDGERFAWGRVLEWDPPRLLSFTWHPGREPETEQRVEVHFKRKGDGTRVELIHHDWHKLGEEAAETRKGYDAGWETVLGRHYAQACENQ